MKWNKSIKAIEAMSGAGRVITTIDLEMQGVWGGLSLIQTPYNAGNWREAGKGWGVDLELCLSKTLFAGIAPTANSHGVHIELWFPKYREAGKVFGKIGRRISQMSQDQLLTILDTHRFGDLNIAESYFLEGV